ncbi:UvrD-helicase domain-containing protein [Pyrococcus kukulkanii]|uniref:DNA 3'-5' helicase n=1 Tax=Pyrococcus kukulkanii TaxID=1609559 RepID=A0ABV4T7V6_9EURY
MRVKIYGPPGCGKTYTLTEVVNIITGQRRGTGKLEPLNEVYSSFDVNDIAFISFARVTISIARSRTPLEDENVRTLHSIAYQIVTRDMSRAEKDRLNKKLSNLEKELVSIARELGLKYNPANPFDVTEGNLFFNAIEKAIHVHYPKARDRAVYYAYDYLPPHLHSKLDRYLALKDARGLVTYDDLLVWAYEELRKGRHGLFKSAFLADEYQDFSPLEAELFRLITRDADFIAIAGDDDQAIYYHKGVTPRIIIKEKADVEIILDKSHRLPRAVHRVAMKVVSSISDRKRKRFLPKDEKGKVIVKNSNNVIADAVKIGIAYAERGIRTFVLFRTNDLVVRAKWEALRLGYLTETLKREGRMGEEFREGQDRMRVTYEVADAIASYVRGQRSCRKMMRALNYAGYKVTEKDCTESGVPMHLLEYVRGFPRNLFTRKLTSKIGQRGVEILKEAMKGRWIARGDLKLLFIDTIHASKGDEADVVVVVDYFPRRRLLKFLIKEWDYEMRVWYVAVTRARKTLYIVRPYDITKAVLANAGV